MIIYIRTKKKEALLSIATYISLMFVFFHISLKKEPFAISEGFFFFAKKQVDNDLYMI